ncbi:MAG: hypothetical protein CL779_02780 [Chloroflexi bacterium]|nr:hypothetical protein [Chloroflexota bacterium]
MDPKHITRTSFCNKEVDNVTDNSMKKYILDNLNIKTGIKYDSRYAKVYNEQFKKNLNNPHIFCLKSSGTPYLLFCSQINDVNYSFLIDKKIKDGYEYPKIFIVHYRFDIKLFQGTLFEVELTRDKDNKWCILLGDIYYTSGISTKNMQIHERINHCNDILKSNYINDEFCNICPLVIKRYFDIQEVHYVINDFIPKLSYKIKGFYFVPLKTSYSKILYLLKDKDYKKVNFVNKSLISFRIIKTIKSDIYELYLYNEQKNNLIKHSYASIPNISTSKWLKDLTDKKEECIVVCQFNMDFKKWTPIKEGTTIDTIVNIKDPS